MPEIKQTETFRKWIRQLNDPQARARINARIRRLSLGNAGDEKNLGDGVREMRIDYGPGYRVYYADLDGTIVVILAGGDKRTQDRDIRFAKDLLSELGNKKDE